MCLQICLPCLFVCRLCEECCKVYICCVWPENKIEPQDTK